MAYSPIAVKRGNLKTGVAYAQARKPSTNPSLTLVGPRLSPLAVTASLKLGSAAVRQMIARSIGRVSVVNPPDLLGRLNRGYVQVDDDRFLPASHEYAFERLIGAGVDLLVRHVRRDVDEVAGSGVSGELEMIAPTYASAAFDDVDDAFKLAVMMRSGFGVGMDGDSARPQFTRAGSCVSDRSSAIHSGCLRRVRVELARVNDANSVMFPVLHL